MDQDGQIVVSFQIGYYEEIIHFLKSWLPYIKILEPEDLKEEIVNREVLKSLHKLAIRVESIQEFEERLKQL